MPNTGKPSQDCHLCRRRRVKCDLTRPSCQRCIRYGAQCPGYRDVKDLMFRNTYAQGLKGSRAATPSSEATEPSGSSNCASILPANSDCESAGLSTPGCCRQEGSALSPTLATVKEHWTTHSLPLLMAWFSQLDFFARVLGSVPEDHPVTIVGHMFARTYLANRYNADKDKRAAFAYLSRALQATQVTINSASRSKEDATIVAVWLLGNYEILVGGFEKQESDMSAWIIHGSGLTSLLRNRGPHNLADPLVRQMFWVMYNNIQIQCMISNTQCPADLMVWLEKLQDYLTPEEESLLDVAKFVITACSLFNRVVPLIADAKLNEVYKIYPDIVQKVEEAEALCPDKYQQLDDHIQQSFWTSWCGARIKLCYFIILMSNIVENTPNSPYNPTALAQQRRVCREITACMSARVINGLPVSLGGCAADADLSSPSAGFTGLRLVWPLTALYMIPTVPTQHRRAAKNALKNIGRNVGILQALKGYQGRKRFPREALSDVMVDAEIPTDGYLPNVCSPSNLNPNTTLWADNTSA